MFKRYSKLFSHDMFDAFPGFPSVGTEDDAGEFEQEKEGNREFEKRDPRVITREVGFEIRSGSDMKEPIVRIFGNPDDIPWLKEQLEGFMVADPGQPRDGDGSSLTAFEPAGLESQAIVTPATDTEEPFSETFNEKDGSIIINVDLPGIKEPDVSVKLDGNKLHVEAHGNNRHYKKAIDIESKAPLNDMSWRLNNGVLEIKIRGASS